MIRNVDLFSIASSGVNASNKLLQTTSNNIANVNTDGYVRERTVFSNSLLEGVGQGTTERVIDVFAQNQLRRDTTSVGELETFTQKTSMIDNLLASEANSISTGLSKFFASVQTAADDPTNLASRESVLGEAEALLRRMGTVSEYMESIEDELNLEFDSQVKQANSLIANIGELNKAILKNQNTAQGEPSGLLNQRDKAINELAEMMAIEVRTNANGTKGVNLSSGESLVLENGGFNLLELTSGPDTTEKQLELGFNIQNGVPQASVQITEDKLGGSLGGLFRFRNEVLGAAQRDVGQMAVAMADAVNTQNKLGMDLDMQLGGSIFTLPEVPGIGYPDNSDTTLELSAQFTEGKGNQVTDADYQIAVNSVDASGNPVSITLTMLNSDGTPKSLDSSGNPVTSGPITVNTAGNTALPGGIEVSFDSAGGYAADDLFLVQPTKTIAADITLATNRPEDFAFAAPVRAQADSSNLGDATVKSVAINDTETGQTPATTAFDGAGGLTATPDAVYSAPVQIVFTSASEFAVYDGINAAPIATVTGVTDYNNLLEQASATAGWPFPAGSDYPGYDISLEGLPVAGDSFAISYNTDGINDNTNARKLAELQQASLVQLSSNSTNQQRTLHDSFSSLIGRVGEKSANAEISLQAAEAMKEQSQNWFESVSGVSLDEEAANLIRYQQSYAAAARILSTAQELFDTILSAAR